MWQNGPPARGGPLLRSGMTWGDMWARPSTAVHRGIAMAVLFARRTLVVPALVIVVHTAALAQTAAAPARPPAGPTGTTAAWTLKLTGDVRWQQVTPAGALLVSTDAALAGVDIDRGQVMWEKADLGGLPTDSVRLVEGSLLVEAARPGLLVILDPVTGAVLFDSRRPGLTQIVTRRVLPQSGTLLVHGRRATGPAVVALYDLVTGEQRWVNEGLFEQTEPKKKGLGGLMHGLVQHPDGIIILPESPPANQATGNVRIVNGVVQTGLNVARYADGTTIADKPLRMRGTVTDALISGGSAVLAVDAESRTFVNVLDVATASVRLKKDVKIKGQLAYAELTPAGLLYISRPDPATNAEVNIIDLATGEQKFKDAIESGKPWGGNPDDYNAAGYSLHHVVEGATLYVFASHDHRLYAVDRTAGTYRALGGEIKLQGGEDPTAMEMRPAGLVLISPQNLVLVARDGQVKQQVYYPAPQLPGLLRALYRINAVRAGLYGAAASAYGDAFAQASRTATDSTARRISGQLATAYSQGGAQLAGYSHQAATLATKRFKASLTVPGSVFMLTRAPDGNGNVLLQIDKESGQPRSRVDLGKEREPVYAVDDVAGMLFLRTASGTLVGYRL